MGPISTAFVGFQNAGKSTVLNALLQGEYTPASSVGCTNHAFRFPLYSPNESTVQSFDLPEDIHKKIRAANQTRDGTSLPLQATSSKANHRYPVLLRENDLYSEILSGFRMEFIDLPGMEKGKGADWFSSHFLQKEADKLACVLVVLDISLTDEESRQWNKWFLKVLCGWLGDDGPSRCIVVGNKDDQLDEEGRDEAIRRMNEDVKEVLGQDASWVHMSTRGILYYRYARGLDMEQFNCWYEDKLKEMGKRLYSTNKEVDRLQKDKQLLKRLYEDLNSGSAYKDALSGDESNFAGLLRLLQSKLGTKDLQRSVLAGVCMKRLKRLDMPAHLPTYWQVWIKEIIDVSEDLRKIDYQGRGDVVRNAFDVMFNKEKQRMIANFKINGDRTVFARTTDLILQEWATQPEWRNWDQERDLFDCHRRQVFEKAINDYLDVIKEQFEEWVRRNANKKRKAITESTWSKMSMHEWDDVITSISVDVHRFAEHFPGHVRFFRWALAQLSGKSVIDLNESPPASPYPDMRTDPKHWGYLIWRYIDAEERKKFKS